jgi:magnesium and cobalt exporter, CNNM family
LDEPGPQVVTLVAGAASFFLSLTEAALEHYSGARLLEVAKKRNSGSDLSGLIGDDEKIHLTVRALALAALLTFILGVYCWVYLGDPVFSTWTVVRAAGIIFLCLLTVARMIPLFLGRIFAEEIIYHLRPVLTTIQLVFNPLTWFMIAVRTLTLRLAGRPGGRKEDENIQEEILSAVEEGEFEGVIDQDEADMIERALDLRDADVADNMQPRTRMFALEIDTDLNEAVEQVSAAGHSRVPVYRNNLDEIVGILYAKDLLRHWGSEGATHLTLARIARKPLFVPETKRMREMLDEFKRRKTHMAIVLDEYGGTAGLITIEDIIEEIVGEIEDEYDETVNVPLILMLGEREAEVDAQVHVDDLGDAMDVEINSDEFDTVGGLVFTALGRVPVAGDEFDYAGLHIVVLAANERSVTRVKAVREAP